MRKKRKKQFSKILVLAILILVAVGFMLPGFLPDSQPQIYVEPRLCQNDADCYLLCEDKPVEALCSQNLCVMNACEEGNFYSYENPYSFTLAVNLSREKLNLAELADTKDLFVKFSENQVSLFSSGLSLAHIFEKVNINFEYSCILVNTTQYCPQDDSGLQMFVNGERSYQYENYVPEAGDIIQLNYYDNSFT